MIIPMGSQEPDGCRNANCRDEPTLQRGANGEQYASQKHKQADADKKHSTEIFIDCQHHSRETEDHNDET